MTIVFLWELHALVHWITNVAMTLTKIQLKLISSCSSCYTARQCLCRNYYLRKIWCSIASWIWRMCECLKVSGWIYHQWIETESRCGKLITHLLRLMKTIIFYFKVPGSQHESILLFSWSIYRKEYSHLFRQTWYKRSLPFCKIPKMRKDKYRQHKKWKGGSQRRDTRNID